MRVRESPGTAPVAGDDESADAEEAKIVEIQRLANDRSDDATTNLLRSAESTSVLISAASIQALAGRGCERVEPLLIRLLEDGEWQRRAWAARVLGANGCVGAKRALNDRLQNERDGRVQALLEGALQHLQGESQ